jgi:predicted short-subunit dehydrogenase-like oxidoreductase (DUF2520 family)
MEKQAKQKIVIVGCGNVAWHIAKHLHSLKKFQLSIYNHKDNPLLEGFRSKLHCKTEIGLDNVAGDASVYFICVTDKFISKTAKKINIKNPNALLLHTSGSAELKDLGNRIHNTGVFYPLQTFSREAEINWSHVPIIVEAGTRDSEHSILHLADLFSKTVISQNYKNRLKLHLAAVLVNNFTNALYASAFDLINRDSTSKDLNFEILLPLIEQTTLKIKELDPRTAQTGPAKRKDKIVMAKHLELISKQDDLKKIYKQLSKLIVKQQEK